MAITPESGGTRQRGLFHDTEVGTEAHDDILAWAVSTAGRQAITRPLVISPLSATCDFSGICTSISLPVGHESRFIPDCESYAFFPRSGQGFRVREEESKARLEVPTQGRNGYFVGFADAIISGKFILTVPGDLYPRRSAFGLYVLERRVIDNVPSSATHGDITEHFKVLVEVKTGRLQLGEALRQLNTYKTLGDFTHRLLIVKQRPPEHYIEALTSEGVQVALFKDYSLCWLSAVR